MSYEKPRRPIVKVFEPRSLVDLAPAVSSALLTNEPEWVGIIVKTINYSLKGAILHIDTGPGMSIEELYSIEIERHTSGTQDSAELSCEEASTSAIEETKESTLQDGKIELPEWASNITSVIWIPVRMFSFGC